MADPLKSLLTWSIANTDTSNRPRAPRAALHPSDNESSGPEVQLAPSTAGPAPTPKPRSDLTSDMLDHIMGKSDAVVMREKLNIALDENNDVNERVFALDDFEMLVEMIDNANNIENMQMWPKIMTLLESSQDPVICHACWISGTAIQNNLTAQKAFLDKDPLPKIFSLISSIHPTTSSVKISPQTRAKAVYCLSSSLKNWPGAVDLLSNDSNRGWTILREGLRDPEMTIRRKIAFLLNALIIQSAETQAGEDGMKRMLDGMTSNGIIDGLVSSLTDPLPVGADGDAEPDWDLQEKSFAALMSAARNGGLNGENKTALVQVIKNWRGAEGALDNVGLSESEADEALATLAA